MAAAAAAELRPFLNEFPIDACIFMDRQKDTFQRAFKTSDASFWLPSEEQLHKLIQFEYSDTHPYFSFIRSAYHAAEAEMPFNLFSSFEQYALAFLMKSKNGKVWCNNEWILI